MKARKEMAVLGGATLALLGGRKATAAAGLASAMWSLEKQWRARNPDFDGDLAARWQRAIDFYEQTHREPTNRLLHQIGIPMIVAGTAGLFLSGPGRPLWMASVGAFGAGWALNLVGHAFYEKNAPAFADDPLAFVAGPVWDLMQLKQKVRREKPAPRRAPEARMHAVVN